MKFCANCERVVRVGECDCDIPPRPTVTTSSTPSTPAHVAGIVLKSSPSTTYDGSKPWFRESADASVSESLALFNRLGRIEEALRRIESRLAPQEPKAKTPRVAKHPKAVLDALAQLAKETGVPTVPADREALLRLTRLHGEEKALWALVETLRDVRSGVGNTAHLARTAPQFVNRNLIAEAGRRFVTRGATRAVSTWRPPEGE